MGDLNLMYDDDMKGMPSADVSAANPFDGPKTVDGTLDSPSTDFEGRAMGVAALGNSTPDFGTPPSGGKINFPNEA